MGGPKDLPEDKVLPKVERKGGLWDYTQVSLLRAIKKAKERELNYEMATQILRDHDSSQPNWNWEKEIRKPIKNFAHLEKRIATFRKEEKQWEAEFYKLWDQVKKTRESEICACEELKVHQESELEARHEFFEALTGVVLRYDVPRGVFPGLESVEENIQWAIDFIEKVCPRKYLRLAKLGDPYAVKFLKRVQRCREPDATEEDSSAPNADDKAEDGEIPPASDEQGATGEDSSGSDADDKAEDGKEPPASDEPSPVGEDSSGPDDKAEDRKEPPASDEPRTAREDSSATDDKAEDGEVPPASDEQGAAEEDSSGSDADDKAEDRKEPPASDEPGPVGEDSSSPEEAGPPDSV